MAQKSRILIFSVCLVAAVIFAVFVSASSRKTAKKPRCYSNLMQLELFKLNWASENNKATNDTPTWNDLRPYFPDSWSNNIPVCPAGGTYIIGKVGEQPKCSIGGGFDHSLLP